MTWLSAHLPIIDLAANRGDSHGHALT